MPRHEDPPAMLLYVDELISDEKVDVMDATEFGAYMRLLCRAWRQDKPGTLPRNDDTLAKWSRVTAAKWKRIKATVMAPFKIGRDRRWHQPRMELEYAKWMAGKTRRSTAGAIAATARWEKGVSDSTSPLHRPDIPRANFQNHRENSPQSCESHITSTSTSKNDVSIRASSGSLTSLGIANRQQPAGPDARDALECRGSEIRAEYHRAVRLLRIADHGPQRAKDLNLLAKAAILAHSVYSIRWLVDSIEAVRAKHRPNEMRYLNAVLRAKARDLGRVLNRDLASVELPADMLDTSTLNPYGCDREVS